MITEVNEYPADDKKVLVTFLMDKELLEKIEGDALQATNLLTPGINLNIRFVSISHLVANIEQGDKDEIVIAYLKLAGVKEKV